MIAAVEALLDHEHNLNGVIQTTHMCVSLAIVSGPLAKQLRFNSADGVFGNGFRANGAVGRALRLAMWNLGGAVPGQTDMATQSNPAEYAYCIAESEDSPWDPLHVERGCAPGDSAVTVFACEGPHSADCIGTPAEMLYVLADTMASLGNNNVTSGGQTLVVLNPRQADEFAKAGWTKHSIRNHLWKTRGGPSKSSGSAESIVAVCASRSSSRDATHSGSAWTCRPRESPSPTRPRTSTSSWREAARTSRPFARDGASSAGTP